MMLLPRDVGSFTLLEKLGNTDITESYLGRSRSGTGGNVVVRRILPGVVHDQARLEAVQNRVRDLISVRHPFLVPVLEWVEEGAERYIIEEAIESVDLSQVLAWCRSNGRRLPPNVFLNIATQVCNALEALHGRPGKASGSDNVLHLGLRPQAVHLSPDGKVILGGFGLTRSPTTSIPGGGTGTAASFMEYLSPEQTQPDKKLSPASDIFSLGALIFELLSGEPLFRSDNNLSTINRIRRAEVADQIARVKDEVPGLDKVLTRALGLNARHRYQRAFVLREDLRALMAGYSFNTIVEDTQAFLAPVFESVRGGPAASTTLSPADEQAQPPPPPSPSQDEDPGFETGLRTDGPQLGTNTSNAGPMLAMGAGLAAHLAQAMTGPTDRLTSPPSAAPVPPVPPVPPPATPRPPAEQLAERAVLSMEGAADGLEERTDVAIGLASVAAAAKADPSSTRAFLRGEPSPEAAPAPPPALPDPTRSGIDELRPARPIAAAPPPIPGIGGRAEQPPAPVVPAPTVPVPTVAVPTVPVPTVPVPTVPAPTVPAPTGPVPTARAAAAPPRAPAPPPPAPTELDDDDEPLPPRRSMLLPVVAGLVAVLIVSCGALGYVLSQQSDDAGATGPALAEAEPPALEAPVTEAPVEEAPVEQAPVEEAPVAQAPDAQAPVEEAPVAQAPVAQAPVEEAPVEQAEPPAPEPSPSVAASREPAAAREPARTTAPRTETASRSPAATMATASRTSTTTRGRPPEPVADLDLPEVVEEVPDISVEQYAAPAARGKLTSSDIMALELVTLSDPDYTRARSLLVMHYRKKGDEEATKRYLDQIMALPENQYNPIYLSDLARHHVNKRQYSQAIDQAALAERHWGRLPPELVFSKKAEIYETQAAAWQGRFYASNNDLELLDQAIRHWQKFRDHVQGRSRPDLVQRADTELAKLDDIRKRLD